MLTETPAEKPDHCGAASRPEGEPDAASGDLDETCIRLATFTQQYGPFDHYERTVYQCSATNPVGGTSPELCERTRYALTVPWFGWLLAWPVRRQLARRGRANPERGMARPPWWAPPDQFDQRQATVLGLLVVASMMAAFANTLFSQTSTFAADAFGLGDSAVGWGGAVVRLGSILILPFAFAADRLGRRRVIRFAAWSAPVMCAAGALAPTFGVLVATQSVARPLGLTIDLLIAVLAAEEMPRSSRAYAVAVMAMSYALGAGFAVMALPLADIGAQGWRFVYLVALFWLIPAWDLARRLPESIRFEQPHVPTPPLNWGRVTMVTSVVILANLFVAPSSYFLNRYLSDARGLSAASISLFTLSVGTPAGLGLVIGGKLADVRGRRLLIAVAIPLSTILLVTAFGVTGVAMWLSSLFGTLIAGIGFPALAVYRAELFPTGNRGRAAGIFTVAALLAGSVSIVLVGYALDRGRSYLEVMAIPALGQFAFVAIVLLFFPESAHRDLDELSDPGAAPALG